MLGAHIFDGVVGIEVETVCDQCLCRLSMLPLLGEKNGASNIPGGLRRRRRCSRSAWATRGLMPELLETAVEKSADPLFDDGRLFLEILLPRWKEKDELRISKGFRPVFKVLGVAEDAVPDGGLESRQVPPRCFWHVTKERDADGEDVVK